ncbi:anti-sigma factor [Corynebacterium qintianiae]|uniref:anti-sigma factor n=1 Tax=Corynebacterium qintianiae TaxID=2709392 RepID=UPI001F1B744B|nr:anti-sigma factor [Corynebacterium qintianiae]
MAMRLPGPGPRKKRRFSSTEHLSPEAVAAFADAELSASALHRARVHVVQCEECRAEVSQQRAAAEHLRCCNADEAVRAPLSLVQKLTEMPQDPMCEDDAGARPRLVDVAYRALKRRG